MSVWLREIAGWLLLGCGLGVFFLTYQVLRMQRVLDAIPLTFIGFVIFRGGLHLIKVATAARLSRQAVHPSGIDISSSRQPPVASRAKTGLG